MNEGTRLLPLLHLTPSMEREKNIESQITLVIPPSWHHSNSIDPFIWVKSQASSVNFLDWYRLDSLYSWSYAILYLIYSMISHIN